MLDTSGLDSLDRRTYLRGISGAVVSAGTGVLTGCTGVVGSDRQRYDVEEEIQLSVVDGGRFDRYSDPTYVLRVDDWSEYGGRADDISLSPTAYDDGLEDGERGPGLIAPEDEYTNTWSPGIHLESNHVPIAYGRKFRERWGTRFEITKFWMESSDCYSYERVFTGQLEDHGIGELDAAPGVYLGALDLNQWVTEDDDGVNVFWATGSEITLLDEAVRKTSSC